MKQFFPLSILLALTLASPAQASTWIADYTKAIAISPDDGTYLNNRGVVLLRHWQN